MKRPLQAGGLQRAAPPLSLEGVSQMVYILPERLLTLVRPFDLVLRRIRSLKRCVQACGCKIETPRHSCNLAARRPRAQRRPPGTGWAGGRGRWPARCACSAPRPRRRAGRPCGTSAPQKPDVLHDAGRHAALQAGGLRALPQRLLAVAVAAQRLPHRHHVVQLAGARRQPAAAQRALAVLRGQGLLPLRRAGHFPLRLLQLQKNLVRQAGQALAPVLLVERLAPPPQHLVLLRQLSDPGAPPASCRGTQSGLSSKALGSTSSQGSWKLTLLRPLMRWHRSVSTSVLEFL